MLKERKEKVEKDFFALLSLQICKQLLLFQALHSSIA